MDEKKPPQPIKQHSAEPPKWDVLVRHTPFLLKNAVIEAATAEEAKQKFLELVKARHEDRATKQKADERGRLSAEKIRQVCTDGMKRVYELDWDIRPAAEVEAERRRYRDKIDQVWGNVRETATMQPV